MLSLRKVLVLCLLLFSFAQVLGAFAVTPANAAMTQFSFASAGDFGFSSAAKTVMSSMGSSGANFALGVGDLLYTIPTGSTNEQTWCNQFKASISNLEIIVGNHETWETNSTDGGGSINKFVKYCPFTLNPMTGTYGFRYYFDYPSTSPLARFILVDPAIWNGTSSSSSISYASGTANFNWVSNAIDNARNSGIPWVIVAMHKICIGTGSQGCEVPQSFLTMLMNKRVDLIIQGHDHTYQRSKQLTCATDGTYVSSCVVNAGSSLTKGVGTVIVIDGTGGEGGGKTFSKPDTGYFAKYCCGSGTPLGYSLFTITSSSLQSTFVNTGGQTYHDSFTITGNSPPPSPSFTVSANPIAVNLVSGHSATSKITVTSQGGFTGSVSLSTSVSPSSGLTTTFNPLSFNVPKGGSASSTVTISSSVSGNYVVNVTGVSGSLRGSATVTVRVSDFSISANPSSLNFAPKASASSTITVTSLNGFSGGVSLSATSSPTGPSFSFSNGSVSVPTNGNASSILQIKSDIAGTYLVSVLGNAGGGLSHKVVLTVTVTNSQPAPDFSIAVNPSTVIFNSGSSGSATATVTGTSGFTGTLTLTTTVSPSGGLSVSCSPSSISLSPSTTSGSSICALASSFAGTYSVSVSASNGTLTRSTTFTVHVSDFSISASPSSVTGAAGSSTSATVTLSSIEQFTGTVTLSVAPSSSSVAATVSPSSFVVPSGSSVTSTLTLSSNTPGSYTVQVTGASGSLSHSANVTYVVGAAPDFTLSASPTSVAMNAGNAGTSTITVSSLNGFNSAVALTDTISPSTGLTCGLNPTNVTPASGGSATSTLSCTGTTTGSYTVTIAGTSGSLAHSATITFQINGTSTNPPAYALVTSFSGQLYKYQNGTMTLIAQPVTTALRLIAWKPDGSYALIVGDSAVLLKWDGSTLTQISTTSVMSSGNDLNTVAWSPDGSYALMGGTDGDLLKYDGTTLARITDSNTHQIQGISWNPAGTTALLVGNGGALFTYQNGIITILNSGTTNDLYGVAWNPNGAYALISGAGGTILRWDGTTATALNTNGLYPSTTIVRYVGWNSPGSQALLVGNAGGLVLSYDGTNLTVLPSGTSNGLFSLTWSGNTATLVGNSGTMLTYSGGVFNTLALGVSSDLRGIAWKPN